MQDQYRGIIVLTEVNAAAKPSAGVRVRYVGFRKGSPDDVVMSGELPGPFASAQDAEVAACLEARRRIDELLDGAGLAGRP